ncbi:MAG: NUDIX hydrolase [Chromatiales bacterium]|jgi:ADP-ribose pyrophosphatase|nr:NUDIX hydrolase [Chromatiales bacterium]
MTDEPEIECVATQVVYENRWMSVREDKIRRPSGYEGIYGVVTKSDFVVIAAIDNDQIHLVEQFRYPVGGRHWELPQGSWEGETPNPLDLAKAELREETGLIADHMTHVGRLFTAYGFLSQQYDVFVASNLHPGPRQLDVEEEGLVTKAFPLAEFEGMLVDGTIRDSTTIAAYGLMKLKGFA